MARYKEGHREETRQKMVEAAGRGFRANGFSGIGVDGLAKEAGVTSGAFYSHFGSKDAAFGIALEQGLDEVIEAIPQYQSAHGKGWVEAFADYYLGQEHRDDLACGCAMTTLTPEVVRKEEELRVEFEDRMAVIIDLVASGLAGGSKTDREKRAWGFISLLTGGLNMSRAAGRAETSDLVADAVKKAALDVAGRAKG